MNAVRAASAEKGSQSTDRALRLLGLVAACHGSGASVATLAAQSGLDRTTTHRLIKALERHGLVHREARTEGYRLGLEAMALGQTTLQRPPLLMQCEPLMKSLVRRVDEPLFLVVRSGDYSHCLHLEEGSRPVRDFGETVASLRLLGLGIPSFALLAHLNDAQVQAHYQRCRAEYEANYMSLMRLRKWVNEARAQGYAHIYAKGIRGVGVRFTYGTCGEAALGFVAPASRLPRAQVVQIAELLRSVLASNTKDTLGTLAAPVPNSLPAGAASPMPCIRRVGTQFTQLGLEC